jgi:hypothetical protein
MFTSFDPGRARPTDRLDDIGQEDPHPAKSPAPEFAPLIIEPLKMQGVCADEL